MDTEKTLKWMHDLCTHAMTEAHNGDTRALNRLGLSNALSFYFNNVFAAPTMNGEVYARNYPHYMKEADELRVQYEKETMREQRTASIENELAELKVMVEKLLTANQDENSEQIEVSPNPETLGAAESEVEDAAEVADSKAAKKKTKKTEAEDADDENVDEDAAEEAE